MKTGMAILTGGSKPPFDGILAEATICADVCVRVQSSSVSLLLLLG